MKTFTLSILSWLVVATAWADPPKVDYNSQIAPLFKKYCVACHNAKDHEGDLVLERYATLLSGGEHGAVVQPGKGNESRLLLVLTGKAEPVMPPDDNEPPTAAEIALIEAWINAGAHGPDGAEPDPTLLVTPKIKVSGAAKPSIAAVAFAPSGTADGSLLAVAHDSRVELYRDLAAAPLRTLADHRGRVNAISFSVDGARLVTAAGEAGLFGEARIWNVADGALVATFQGHQDSLYSALLSPDGKTLATSSYDQQIKLWDVATAKEIKTLTGHNDAVYELAFRPDGKILASASGDRTVKLWDIASGQRLDTFGQPLKEVYSVAFSPDGNRVAAGGVDNRIRIWNLSADAKENTNPLVYSRFAHEGAVIKLVYSLDGKTMVSSAEDRTVKVWDAETMTERFELDRQPDWTPALSISADNQRVAVGRLDGSLVIYELSTGKPLASKTADVRPTLSNIAAIAGRSLLNLAPRSRIEFAALAASFGALADPPPSPAVAEITSQSHRGAQRGVTVSLKVQGKNLAEAQLKTNHEQLVGKLIAVKADEVQLELTPAADLPLGRYEFWLTTPAGETAKRQIDVDDLPQQLEAEPNDAPSQAAVLALPADAWGVLQAKGDIDCFAFDATKGQTIVVDVRSSLIGSKANLVATVIDAGGRVLADNNDFDGQADPFLAVKIPANGRYTLRISDLALAGSADHFYRATIGALSYATGIYPLSAPANADVYVEFSGFNLPEPLTASVHTPASGEVDVPLANAAVRVRRPLKLLVGEFAESREIEPNNVPSEATPLAVPGTINGRIMASAGAQQDVDLYRFESAAGQSWIVETDAARRGSPVDTIIDVLHADGRPVERALLQATRDSFVTFRGIDANSRDCRLANWEEMQLNEFVYIGGEVNRLFRAPQGPDSGFQFYEGESGKRRCYLDTSATIHALDEPAYIIAMHPPGAKLVNTGLPVFKLYYANDDDGQRRWVGDSRLTFTAPAAGSFLVRVRDARGEQGVRHAYRLTVRPPKPDFQVSLGGGNPTVEAGSGKPFTLTVDRSDDFVGPVQVEISGLPPGFATSAPLVIEPGVREAKGVIYAAADAPAPTAENQSTNVVTATAMVDGHEVKKTIGNLGQIKLGPKPKILVRLEPADLVIAPGTTISATLKVERNGHDDLITFNVPNLPHGMIVDNIGLNGVLMPKGENERQIFLTAAAMTAETDRACFAQAEQAGIQASPPVTIHVRRNGRLAGAVGQK